MAKQMAAHHPIDTCDAIGFGNVGLLQAAQSFRARKGVSFRVCATIRIRGAILGGVRAGGPVPRPLCRRHGGAKATSDRHARHLAGMLSASELGIIATFHTHDERTRTPEQALVDAERRLAIRNALARLPRANARSSNVTTSPNRRSSSPREASARRSRGEAVCTHKRAPLAARAHARRWIVKAKLASISRRVPRTRGRRAVAEAASTRSAAASAASG